MAEVDLEHVHGDIMALKQEIELIKNILAEEYDLSDEARDKLEEAREVSDEELVPHEEVVEQVL